MKKYKNIKFKYELTQDNCTYYPELKASCLENCLNRRKDSNGKPVSDDYISILESERTELIKFLLHLYVNYEMPYGTMDIDTKKKFKELMDKYKEFNDVND